METSQNTSIPVRVTTGCSGPAKLMREAMNVQGWTREMLLPLGLLSLGHTEEESFGMFYGRIQTVIVQCHTSDS